MHIYHFIFTTIFTNFYLDKFKINSPQKRNYSSFTIDALQSSNHNVFAHKKGSDLRRNLTTRKGRKDTRVKFKRFIAYNWNRQIFIHAILHVLIHNHYHIGIVVIESQDF